MCFNFSSTNVISTDGKSLFLITPDFHKEIQLVCLHLVAISGYVWSVHVARGGVLADT